MPTHIEGQDRPQKATLVSCPHCGTETVWRSENTFRPFCSERCKLIDLGAWATEQYRVPVQETSTDFDSVDGENLSA